MAYHPRLLTHAVAAVVAGALCLGTPTEAQRLSAWEEAATADLRVVSDAGHERTTELLQRMIAVRQLLARATGLGVGDTAAPVLVLAPKGKSGMREVVGDAARRSPGLLLAAALPSPFNHQIAIRADAREARAPSILLHEYAHLVTRAHVGDVPAWLDEGVSDFWSTLVEHEGQLVVGAPIGRYVKILRGARAWIPLKELVAVSRGRYDLAGRRLELFYAQSWALVHHLLVSTAPDGMTYAPQLPADTDLEMLGETVRAWVQGPMAAVALRPHPIAASTGPVSVRRLTEADTLAVRAGVLAYGEQPDRAIGLAGRALSLEPDHPRALEAMGVACFLTNRPDLARAWLAQAVQAPEAGYLAHYYFGVVLFDQPMVAAKHLRRSLELRPNFAPALERLKQISGLAFH